MSKKYKFTRFDVVQEQLTFQERKERSINGIPIKNYISLFMDTNDFMDKLFGIENFFFVPKKEGVFYQKNMTEKMMLHCLYLLESSKDAINLELYQLMKYLLVSVRKLIASKGWTENKLLYPEISALNRFLQDKNSEDIQLESIETPVVEKNLVFYVNQDRNKVLSAENILREDFTNYEPNVLFIDRGYSIIDELECSINALCDLLQGLSVKQSYTKEGINYSNGETDDFTHSEVIAVAKQLGGVIRYTINCASWRSNELFYFDKVEFEIKSKFRVNEAFCQFYSVVENN